MTHNKTCEFIHLLNKLQEMLKSLHCFACSYVLRDKTDQLDNKDIAKEFIERNEQHRNYLDSFRCSNCIHHLKTFSCLKPLIQNHNLLRFYFQF